MISSIAWIPRGASNPFPKKFDPNGDDMGQMTEEEVKAMQEEEEEEKRLEKEEEKSKKSSTMSDKDKDFMNRYNFDDYDSDNDDDEEDVNNDLVSNGGEGCDNSKTEEVGLKFINRAMKGLMFYKDTETDPYLANDDEEEIEDIEDVIIRPTDSILVSAIVTGEDDYSHLDIMVYEEDCDNLYVHHDIILSSYPIALAWTDQNPISPEEKGSFIAVGTFEPSIEIWDLDIVDNLIPTVILGGKEESNPKLKKNKGKNPNKFKQGSHKDSVMSLSWNSQQRNVLASGSSDKTVKVWDITTQACLNTFTHHKDKISALQWNSQEKTALLCGSHDKNVSIIDIRAPDSAYKWNVSGEVESISWNPHNSREFIVGTDDGRLLCYDATLGTAAKPVWSIQAHDQGISSFSVCPGQAGFIATGSSDNTLKLWKVDQSTLVPTLLEKKNLSEEVFTVSFFQNSPYILAVGSENQRPNIVDTKRFISVQNGFGLAKPENSKEPTLITKNRNGKDNEDDDDEDDSDEDDEIEDEDEEFEDEEQEQEEEPVKPQQPIKKQQSTTKTTTKTTTTKKPVSTKNNNKKDVKVKRKVGDSDDE